VNVVVNELSKYSFDKSAACWALGALQACHPDALSITQPAYNRGVARGWESKSVELQQEDARSADEPKRHLTAEQRQIESRKEGLKLSRSRILEQIHSTENPRYRKILEQALAALDEQAIRLG
jgi:hypothetical protein